MTYDGIDCILFTAENCIQRKQVLEKELRSLPSSGTVVMHKRMGESVPYVHCYEQGKTVSKRISEAEAERIRKEAARRLLLKEELRGIENFLKHHRQSVQCCYEILKMRISRYQAPVAQGLEGENEYRASDKIHVSKRKEHMRSRAEVIVANCLYDNHLEYRYEKMLKMDGKFYYPDFTVINPLSGADVYLEYCGIDSPDYEYKLQKKVALYRRHHIIEGITAFCNCRTVAVWCAQDPCEIRTNLCGLAQV